MTNPTRKARRGRQPPIVYVVEDCSGDPDPDAARKVLAWLRDRMVAGDDQASEKVD